MLYSSGFYAIQSKKPTKIFSLMYREKIILGGLIQGEFIQFVEACKQRKNLDNTLQNRFFDSQIATSASCVTLSQIFQNVDSLSFKDAALYLQPRVFLSDLRQK